MANHAPVIVMLVSMDASREPVIRAVFWPGALPGKVSTLGFAFRSGGGEMVFETAAAAGRKDWNVVSTTRTLPGGVFSLSDLSEQFVQIEVASPGSAAGTVFSLEDISRVM